MMRVAFLMSAAAVLAGPALAAIVNPKVTTDTSVDCTSREAVLRDIIKPGMTDEEKAVAVWRFVRSRVYHYAQEDRSPLRQLNVYGYALCGTQAHLTTWLLKGVFGDKNTHGAGVYGNAADYAEKKRLAVGWLLDSWERGAKDQPGGGRLGHSMYEVFYDGRWHYLDPHAGFYVYTGDNSIASLDEIKSDPTLVSWPFKKSEPFMPCDHGDGLFFYKVSGGGSGWGGPIEVKETMDFTLRRGDTFIRLYDKLPGKYVNAGGPYGGWKMDYLAPGPRHPCADLKEASWRHYGNGILEYAPDLFDDSLTDGLVASENVAFKEGVSPALQPADPSKPMSFILRTALPYALIDFSLNAAVHSGEVPVTVTLGAGKQTQRLWTGKPGVQALELSDIKVAGQYAYDLTFTFPPGKAGERVGLDALRMKTICQLNYFALPRLVSGKNKVRVTFDEKASKGRLRVAWLWTTAGGGRSDERVIEHSGTEYDVDGGSIITEPKENPKYMRFLRLEVRP